MPVKTADTRTRDKLKDIREQLATKRSERGHLRSERDRCREAFGNAEVTPDQMITESREFKEAEQAVAAVGRCEDAINGLEGAEAAILKMLGDGEPSSSHSEALELSGYGWNGRDLLRSSDQYVEARDAGVFTSDAHFGTINLGKVCDRESFSQFMAAPVPAPVPNATPGNVSNALTSTPGLLPPDHRGLQSPQLMPLGLLNMIPTGTTDSNSIDYVQLMSIPGSAAEVAELAVKPEEGISFQDATAPVRTIAGWIKMSRQSMDDMAGLTSMINTLLPYDVRRRIERQILVGDGVGQNLRGLLNTTGIGALPYVATDNLADAVLKAVTAVLLSDQNANFVTLNPVDWQNLALTKTTGSASSGEYIFGMPGLYNTTSIWGLTVTQNRLIAQGAPIVGDSNAATVLVREGVNVKTSDADQDDFVRNRVTILAEARVAFLVWRPSAFVVIDMTA